MVPVVSYSWYEYCEMYSTSAAIASPRMRMRVSSGVGPKSLVPGGRSIRPVNVWLVMSTVGCRSRMKRRTDSVSASDHAYGPW